MSVTQPVSRTALMPLAPAIASWGVPPQKVRFNDLMAPTLPSPAFSNTVSP